MTLLTRPEAAAKCRVSLRNFDDHVRPGLTPIRIVAREGGGVSTPSLDSVPWVAFLRRDPKTSRVVTAVNRPNALAVGRSALRSNDVDVVVICEGESNAEAVARVAGRVE